MRDGHFPKAREIGPSHRGGGRIGWLKREVMDWIDARPIRDQLERQDRGEVPFPVIKSSGHPLGRPRTRKLTTRKNSEVA
jgi:hypothetical protein